MCDDYMTKIALVFKETGEEEKKYKREKGVIK